VTEYLFRNEELLNEVIDTAIEDNTFRSDDLEFTFAARVRNPLSTAAALPPEILFNVFLANYSTSIAAL
jgi:hypothetical protein